ncbi:MAG TPA: hypothetical protein VKD72_00425 [Gemmataceae bacterium]|nr:hypothetical protein [Gemmataceae bacterium]
MSLLAGGGNRLSGLGSVLRLWLFLVVVRLLFLVGLLGQDSARPPRPKRFLFDLGIHRHGWFSAMKQHAGVITVDHGGLPLLAAERLRLLAAAGTAAATGTVQHGLNELLNQLLLTLNYLRGKLQDSAPGPALLRLSGLPARLPVLAGMLAGLLLRGIGSPLARLP